MVSKAVVVSSPAGGMCGCSQNAYLTMRILPKDTQKPIWGKNALKPRAIQPAVSTMTSAKSDKGQSGHTTSPSDFVLIDKYITTVDH